MAPSMLIMVAGRPNSVGTCAGSPNDPQCSSSKGSGESRAVVGGKRMDECGQEGAGHSRIIAQTSQEAEG